MPALNYLLFRVVRRLGGLFIFKGLVMPDTAIGYQHRTKEIGLWPTSSGSITRDVRLPEVAKFIQIVNDDQPLMLIFFGCRMCN